MVMGLALAVFLVLAFTTLKEVYFSTVLHGAGLRGGAFCRSLGST